jgi:single-stranded DNA-binding protein
MGQFKGTADGGIVAAPEVKSFDSGATLIEFPLYVNHRTKNRDSGEYEDSGDVTKIKVKVWSSNDNYDFVSTLRKNDIVEVEGTFKEREYDKKDGTKGRAFETDWVESVTLKFRKDEAGSTPAASSGGDGFIPDGFDSI